MILYLLVGSLFLHAEVPYKTQQLGLGKVMFYQSPPKSCKNIREQAETTLQLSKEWIEKRKKGNRRMDSGQLIFFQFEQDPLRQEFSDKMKAKKNQVIKEVYYDPFEFLGYLYQQSLHMNCEDSNGWKEPKWPFRGFEIPYDEIEVKFLKNEQDRFVYVESNKGVVTDLYFCKNKLSAKNIQKILDRLRDVFDDGRQEDTKSFKDFTKYREELCGESQ